MNSFAYDPYKLRDRDVTWNEKFPLVQAVHLCTRQFFNNHLLTASMTAGKYWSANLTYYAVITWLIEKTQKALRRGTTWHTINAKNHTETVYSSKINFQKHWRSSQLLLLDRSYITYWQWPMVKTSLAPFLRYYDWFPKNLKTSDDCDQTIWQTVILANSWHGQPVYKIWSMRAIKWLCVCDVYEIVEQKNWVVVGCWRGYLSEAMCRFGYGAADATATDCLLLQ